MRTTYDPQSTMREARARYFAVNKFGDDGGYDDKWVAFKLGPIPFPIPNPPSRVRAVRYHDFHHLLTDYDTDLVGEFEISAWEIGAGCKDFMAAWALNLAGMTAGVLTHPSRTWRAFVRGRHTDTFYGRPLEPLLDLTVAEARRMTRVDQPQPSATLADGAWFFAATLAGSIDSLLFLAITVPLLPVGLAAAHLAKRASRTAT